MLNRISVRLLVEYAEGKWTVTAYDDVGSICTRRSRDRNLAIKETKLKVNELLGPASFRLEDIS